MPPQRIWKSQLMADVQHCDVYANFPMDVLRKSSTKDVTPTRRCRLCICSIVSTAKEFQARLPRGSNHVEEHDYLAMSILQSQLFVIRQGHRYRYIPMKVQSGSSRTARRTAWLYCVAGCAFSYGSYSMDQHFKLGSIVEVECVSLCWGLVFVRHVNIQLEGESHITIFPRISTSLHGWRQLLL